VHAIALSPDGKKVASGSGDGAVMLWDINIGKMTKWAGHTGAVKSVCWIGDGRQIVSRCHERTARERDAESGESILRPFKMRDDIMSAFVYSPEKNMIATTGFRTEGTPMRYSEDAWNVKTRELVTTLEGGASSKVFKCVLPSLDCGRQEASHGVTTRWMVSLGHGIPPTGRRSRFFRWSRLSMPWQYLRMVVSSQSQRSTVDHC
jgi:WD40 repeat protein